MTLNADREQERLRNRIVEITGSEPRGRVEIVTDTTSQLNIYRGHVVRLEGREFYVLGDVMEPRFGLDDQPKYWVKKTRALKTGKVTILKLVFFEEFMAHVGPIRIRCFRSPAKESQVLDLVRGDDRFMQGVTLHDEVGNEVRVIDYIHGKKVFDMILDLEMSHEEYYSTQLRSICETFISSMEAIRRLHQANLCHGDIRNDHLIIDRDSGKYRWIDFDLSQHYPDFDVWSFGNVLQFLIGKGMLSFHEVRESDKFAQRIKDSLNDEDASAFYHYRIMNLQKVFPYISEKLNRILLHFSMGANKYYDEIDPLIEDFGGAVADIPSSR